MTSVRVSLPLLRDAAVGLPPALRSEVLPSVGRLQEARARAEPRAVRLSITDRCDLACVYCRPHRRDGYMAAERRVSADRWAVLVAGLVRRGVRRVRITGGEPLVHPEVVSIVRAIAAVDGVEDIALTTNATLLKDLAAPLRDAGLRRVNISIDSLDVARFWRLTRGGRLDVVLAGIDAARQAGFELKTNTVVVGDQGEETGNVGELEALARWAWSIGATPRFLELMTVGEGANLRDRVVPYSAVRARLATLIGEDPGARETARGPAVYVSARDGSGRRIGFITGTTETFCLGCDRLRATSDGKLRPCLATNDSVDVSTAISEGDVEAIARGLDEAWAKKPDGRTFRGCTEASAAAVSMRATGG